MDLGKHRMAVAPITLYLDLEPGLKADLETVAAASIAWSKAIKELAFIIDPTAEVRVELQSGTEGSLGLNTLVRLIKGVDRKTLAGVLVGLGVWLGTETAGWIYENMLDDLAGQHDELSDKDIARIVEAVERGAGRQQVQRVYREVERDPAIRGIGVTTIPGAVPAHIVPRSEFRALAGLGVPVVEEVRRRTTPDRIEAVLIKPVLVFGSRRKWRFVTRDGEVGFVMDDDTFVESVLRGQRPLGMKEGIIVTMDVLITEQLSDAGVWTITERHITRVVGVREPDSTMPLAFTPNVNEADDDED